LTASYELLTRQVHQGAAGEHAQRQRPSAGMDSAPGLWVTGRSQAGGGTQRGSGDLRRQAWQWALAHRSEDGTLPSGGAIAHAYGRQERWGRLVKNAGLAGGFGSEATHEPARPDSA